MSKRKKYIKVLFISLILLLSVVLIQSSYARGTGIRRSSTLTVQDEGGSVKTAVRKINFVGSGVTASDVGGVATVTVTGGGGGSGSLNIENVTANLITGAGTINAKSTNIVFTTGATAGTADVELGNSITVATSVTITAMAAASTSECVQVTSSGTLQKTGSACGAGGSGATTDGGAVTYVTSVTDDFSIGGTDSTAPFFFDEGLETLTIAGTITGGSFTSSGSGVTTFNNGKNATNDVVIHGDTVDNIFVADVSLNKISLLGTLSVKSTTVDFTAPTDNYILTYDSATTTWSGEVSTSGGVSIETGTNIIMVPCATALNTAISSATAGDTLMLGSCDYEVTSDVTVSKALNIIGQGVDATTISTTVDNVKVLAITSDNTYIENMTISATGSANKAIEVAGTAGSVFSNVNLENIIAEVNGTGSNLAIDYRDAGGTVKNSIILATSSDNVSSGIRLLNLSTAEAATTLNAYNINVVVSSGAGTISNGIESRDASATQTGTFTVYGCHVEVNETGAVTSSAAKANGDSAVLTIRDCVLDGQDFDTSIATSGVLNVNSSNYFVNRTSTSDATDQDGVTHIISSKAGTGLGDSILRIKTSKQGTATGSAVNPDPTDRIVVVGGKTITEDSATSLFSINVGTGTTCGGTILWETSNTDGTDFQVISGMTSYAVVNKAGTHTTNIVNNTSNDAKVVTAGTLTNTWSMTNTVDDVFIKVLHNSSLTPTSGHPRINYTVHNNCYKDVTIQ